MKSRILAFLLLGLTVPALASAQSLKPGTWSGFASGNNSGEEIPLTFDVSVMKDSLGIVIHAGSHGDFTATEVHFAEQTISFNVVTANKAHCALKLNQDGNYTGDCVGEDGRTDQMTMVPPK